METSPEGSPLKLAEQRTKSFDNRKIIIGSTPTFIDTSNVLRAYAESDQRVFECLCPACGVFNEIQWAHIVWPEGEPERAEYECPHCKGHISERFKVQMVENGVWRATRPEVKKHAGFRLNALVSLLANASWAKLAAEFLTAKDDPGLLRPFVNTVLGQGWSVPTMIDEGALAARAEPFDLNAIPPEVLIITAGADVQDDRIELSVIGWSRDNNTAFVLAHIVTWGSFQDSSTWAEIDEILRSTWRHPWGGRLRIDAACIDAGDGEHYDHVIKFCLPRMSRRVFAIKGMNGARPAFQMAKGRSIANKLAIVGIDTIKTVIFDRLQRGQGIRFSKSLEPIYYEQLASERRVVHYVRGQPKRRFERIGRPRNESLDALVYNFAARQALTVNFERREAELRGRPLPRLGIAEQLAHTPPDQPIHPYGGKWGPDSLRR